MRRRLESESALSSVGQSCTTQTFPKLQNHFGVGGRITDRKVGLRYKDNFVHWRRAGLCAPCFNFSLGFGGNYGDQKRSQLSWNDLARIPVHNKACPGRYHQGLRTRRPAIPQFYKTSFTKRKVSQIAKHNWKKRQSLKRPLRAIPGESPEKEF